MLKVPKLSEADRRSILDFDSDVLISMSEVQLTDALTPLKKILNSVKVDFIESLQKISIDLVKLTSNIQSYCFKKLDYIQATIITFLPLVKPIFGAKSQDLAKKIENISVEMADLTSKSEKVIRDIEKALKENDFKILKDYEKDITGLNEHMKKTLKS